MEHKIILSGNCYWCLEAIFQRINGVSNVKSGYYHIHNYPYSFGDKDKVEAISFTYDDSKITIEALIDVFFISHTPTLVTWDENSIFPLCRSAIFVNNNEEKKIIEEQISKHTELFTDPIQTKVDIIKPNCFTAAPEKEHDYYDKNPNDGYCLSIIEPKLIKLKSKLSYLLK